MSPFWQSVLVSVITGGSFTAILTFVQFLIRRHDEKTDKKSGIQAELTTHGEQLDNMMHLVKDGNDEQKKIQHQLEKQGEAIAGLDHDRIVHLGKGYIKKGSISLEEYDDIRKYLYEPYKKLGGNGTAEDVMNRLRTMVETGGIGGRE